MSAQDLQKYSPNELLAVAGVVKFNYKKAGYPDVYKIAEKWANTPGFIQVLVRPTSVVSFGIQFVFVANKKEFTFNKFHKTYIAPLRKQGLIYAEDVSDLEAEDIVLWETFPTKN